MLRVSEEEAQRLLGLSPLPVQYVPGAKRRPKPKYETGLTSSCVELLHSWGVFCWRSNTGGYVREYIRKDKSRGKAFIKYGFKGSGDILGLTLRGRFMSIENKTLNGELGEDQEYFRDAVQKSGGLYLIVRSLDKLEEYKPVIMDIDP